MELILINTYKQLEVYEKEWSALLEVSVNTNPFIEYTFVYNWWKFLGENEKVAIYAVRENNQLIAFFPLQWRKKGFSYILQFLAYGDANYMDIIAQKRDMGRVIMFVFDTLIRQKKHIVFCLHGLLESAHTPDHLSMYLKARSIKEKYYRIETPYIDLQNISYEQYMKTRQRSHGLVRREKKLQALGNVLLQISPATRMEEIFSVHQKRWKKKKDTSGFSGGRKKDFFQALAEQTDGNMGVRLITLTLEDEIVAFEYGFSCRGRYLAYVLGHDTDFDVYGPGRILVKEKIKKTINDGYYKLDMSIGYEPYKYDWNTHLDYTTKMIFSTNTFRAKMYRQLMWMKETLISKVKENYSFVKFRRNTLGKIHYYLKNKEIMFSKKVTWSKKIRSTIFERNEIILARLTNYETNMKVNFQTITTEKALALKKNRKEIMQKMYYGYKGYYSTHINKAFWVNETSIRIDELKVVNNLTKRSVFIREWQNEDIERVISFVYANYEPKEILVHVNKREKKQMKQLEMCGFQFTHRFSYVKLFFARKVKREELI